MVIFASSQNAVRSQQINFRKGLQLTTCTLKPGKHIFVHVILITQNEGSSHNVQDCCKLLQCKIH